MENLCHTMAGVVLARAGLNRTTPLATATLVIASNLPDVDIIAAWWGDLAYLEHHRGVTHSLIGLVVQGPILAGAVFVFDRMVRLRRSPDAEPTKFGALTLVALVGLFVHLLLDWTNSYGIRPLLPFDESWYYGDLVFIVDPWLWLMLGGAIFLGSRRHWSSNIIWGLLFAAMSAAVAFSLAFPPSEAAGLVAVGIWGALLAVLLAVRARWNDIAPHVVALAAITAVVLYWGLLAGMHAVAVRSLESETTPGTTATVVMPKLMRPDRWRGFVANDSDIRAFEMRLGAGRREDSTYVRHLDDPSVRAALQTCPGSVATGFSRLLFAETIASEDGSRSILLRDARFASVPGRPDFATTTVPIDSAGQPAADSRPCPRGLWPW